MVPQRLGTPRGSGTHSASSEGWSVPGELGCWPVDMVSSWVAMAPMLVSATTLGQRRASLRGAATPGLRSPQLPFPPCGSSDVRLTSSRWLCCLPTPPPRDSQPHSAGPFSCTGPSLTCGRFRSCISAPPALAHVHHPTWLLLGRLSIPQPHLDCTLLAPLAPPPHLRLL